jgi:hypothetical protein
MHAEVEALLARLDAGYLTATDIANAAALIRAQAEEIAQLQTDYAALMNKYAQPCCRQWDTCERQCVPLVKRLRVRLALANDEWNALDAVYKRASEQIAAAARQEPVAVVNVQGDGFNAVCKLVRSHILTAGSHKLYAAPVVATRQEPVKATCFHTINPKDAEDDHGFALKPGRYAMYPADLKLYAEHIPAGDAVSVRADVIAFLHGESPLEGHWYGESWPPLEGKFWWRKYLPESK